MRAVSRDRGMTGVSSIPEMGESEWPPRQRCQQPKAEFRMEQQGLTTRDLERYIDSSSRVSEVLNRKRPLSLRMVKRLHDELCIPYESLLSKVA